MLSRILKCWHKVCNDKSCKFSELLVGEGDESKIFTFYLFLDLKILRRSKHHVKEDQKKKNEIDLW